MFYHKIHYDLSYLASLCIFHLSDMIFLLSKNVSEKSDWFSLFNCPGQIILFFRVFKYVSNDLTHIGHPNKHFSYKI